MGIRAKKDVQPTAVGSRGGDMLGLLSLTVHKRVTIDELRSTFYSPIGDPFRALLTNQASNSPLPFISNNPRGSH